MEEIEVKILEVNQEQIINKLEALGARKVFDGEVYATYYDFDNGYFSHDGKIVRLRKKGETCELTFKEKISKEEAKIMDEFEVKVDDFDSMKTILEKFGLKEYKQSKKQRISYSLDGIHFELDTFQDVPTFLEIEAPTVEKLKQYVAKLGFSFADDAKPWSAKEVLEYYGKE